MRGPARDFLTLLGLLACLLPAALAAESLEARVVGVSDGDTIKVVDAGKREFKVRLEGVDAPEYGQPYSAASKRHLSDLVYGKPVRIEAAKADDYGRLVGKVLVRPKRCRACEPTVDVNLAQIAAGMAWWYRYFAREQRREDRERYEAAESEARAKRIGLWREPDPVPPYEWRKAHRRPRQGPASSTPPFPPRT